MSADYHGSRVRCRLPDNLVGIGQAGKRIVDHYLSQEWILEQGVAEFDSWGIPEGFDAYLVDTEAYSQQDDERRVREHTERIEAIAEQSGRPPETVSTSVEYINPVDDAPDELVTRAGLTSAASVREIAEEAGLDAWWLEDDDRLLNDGYDHGLSRRRGLGKALLHASQAGNGRMAALPAELAGSTTIVVGLGGGTGAGMAIDLAKQIEGYGQTNLVATLPAPEESDENAANAFAALSELEYLALQGQNPFTNILLVPFAPASDLDDHEGFLDGVTKAIVARENLVAVDRLDESGPNPLPPAFAPFTVAIPQTLRYTVEDVKDVARTLRAYRDEKREALDAELDLYRELREVLIEEWGGDVGEALDDTRDGVYGRNEEFRLNEADTYFLRGRIEELEAWLGEEAFDSLDNKAIHEWRDQLADWRDVISDAVGDRPTEEFVGELTARLRSRVETLQPPEDRYPAEPDEQALDSLVRDEVRAIALRADLLRAGRLIEVGDPDAEPVGKAITAAMDPGRDVWVAARDLENESDRFAHEINAVESDLDTLDDLEADLVERRDEAVDSWHDAVVDDVEALVEVDALTDEIHRRLDDLEHEIVDAVRKIEGATAPDELPDQLFDFDFAPLNDALEAVGLDPIDPGAVRQSVELTATAFEAWFDYRSTGLVGRIFNRQEEAENRYLQAIVGIDDRYVDVVPSTDGDLEAEDFHCESVAGERFDRIRDQLAEERAKRIDAIVDEFERTLSEADGSAVVDSYRDRWAGDGIGTTWPGAVEDAPEQLYHRLESGFESNAVHAAFDELLAPGRGSDSPGPVHEALHEAYLGPVEHQRDELEATLETLESSWERYELLGEILKDHGDRVDALDPDRPDFDEAVAPGDATDDPYLAMTAAEDRAGLLQYEDLAESFVWEDADSVEMRKIRSHFQQFAEHVGRNGDLVGLRDGHIDLTQTSDGDYADARRPVYDGHILGNIVMSRTFETDHAHPSHPIFKEADEVLDHSQLHFESNAHGYDSQSLGCGAPWDLSMVTFVGGVFLDNIRGIDRYREAYESQRSELDDAIRIRHTHGLDGTDPTLGDEGAGAYVYRDALFDLDDPADVDELLDASEEEVAELLLDDYVARETFGSTIDLDRG
ncbi:tubulin-like doman-containing protein [Halobellus ordinarius]|uniref:tubulin-like doman-containing protein n=1 Tax=Halobellus ordinarius TaxID=3075120 RepID=UPI0028806112|nr:tubulin-like doman-containing protein [Halobellus sp. ZY16]